MTWATLSDERNMRCDHGKKMGRSRCRWQLLKFHADTAQRFVYCQRF